MACIKETVIRAIEFAAQRHKGQTRKGNSNSPYINHPIKVVSLLIRFHEYDSDLLSAAALHDIIEDTAKGNKAIIKLKMIIEEQFGSKILRIVQEVTDDKQLPFHERKHKQVKDAPNLSNEAKKIKLADKISNLQELKEDPPVGWSKERKKAYIEWAGRVIQGVRGVNKELEEHFDKTSKEAYETINSSDSIHE